VPDESHHSAPDTSRWFGKPEGGFSLRPLTWQGRFALGLWAVLCVLAIALYTSQLGLMVFVVALYTAALAGIVLMKSDLRRELEHRAGEGPDSSR
jgi:hypothetical protein